MCNFPEVSLYSLVNVCVWERECSKSLIVTENCSLKEKLRETSILWRNMLFTCKLSISEIKNFKTKKIQYGSRPAFHLWVQTTSVSVLFTCVIQAVRKTKQFCNFESYKSHHSLLKNVQLGALECMGTPACSDSSQICHWQAARDCGGHSLCHWSWPALGTHILSSEEKGRLIRVAFASFPSLLSVPNKENWCCTPQPSLIQWLCSGS